MEYIFNVAYPYASGECRKLQLILNVYQILTFIVNWSHDVAYKHAQPPSAPPTFLCTCLAKL